MHLMASNGSVQNIEGVPENLESHLQNGMGNFDARHFRYGG